MREAIPAVLRGKVGIWVLDIQERLLATAVDKARLRGAIGLCLEAARLFSLPLLVTEHMPNKLGKTDPKIQALLPKETQIYTKSTFSGYRDPALQAAVAQRGVDQWVLLGLETHICVTLTALDLIQAGYNVWVPHDGVRARQQEDHAYALQHMMQWGISLLGVETLVYALLTDANDSRFSSLLPLIKAYAALSF